MLNLLILTKHSMRGMQFLAHESAFMTSFTGAVTGEGRKLNNYDFDPRIVGFPTKDGRVALASATGLSIPAADKNMGNAKRALAALCSAEAKCTADFSGIFLSAQFCVCRIEVLCCGKLLMSQHSGNHFDRHIMIQKIGW